MTENRSWIPRVHWSRPQVLFTALLLAVLFSVQFPLPGIDSQFASLNLSDLVVVCICVAFLGERVVTNDWKLSFPLARVTGLYIVVSVWIVVTVAVAVVREPVSVVPSALWSLKWLEILAVFILAQQYREEIEWRSLVAMLVGGALLIALATIVHTATTSGWNRPTVLWQNPNTLGVFLGLPSLLCLVFGAIKIRHHLRVGVAALATGLVFALGVIATGSRSGMIVLVVGSVVAVVLARDRISKPALVGSTGGGVILGISGLWLTGRITLLGKFFPSVTLQEGTIVLSGPGTDGIYTRYRLFLEAVDLWIQQPIFGYGWFASPENPRVGYLDVLFSQLLVDVGLIGLVIVLGLYLGFVRAFICRMSRSSPTLCVAGASWIVGMLAAGLGGSHVRVPRLMFLLVLVLAAAAHLSNGEGANY